MAELFAPQFIHDLSPEFSHIFLPRLYQQVKSKSQIQSTFKL